MKAKLVTTQGEIVADLNGLNFTMFRQQIFSTGYWLTANHSKFLAPSQIITVELVIE